MKSVGAHVRIKVAIFFFITCSFSLQFWIICNRITSGNQSETNREKTKISKFVHCMFQNLSRRVGKAKEIFICFLE